MRAAPPATSSRRADQRGQLRGTPFGRGNLTRDFHESLGVHFVVSS